MPGRDDNTFDERPNARADCVLVCYSLCDLQSFAHVSEVYASKARFYYPHAKLMLVGLKLDTPLRMITMSEGVIMMAEIGADRFVECSARTTVNLFRVFREATACVGSMWTSWYFLLALIVLAVVFLGLGYLYYVN